MAKRGPKVPDIDPEQVEKLSAIGATIKEMAGFFKCSDKHLSTKFSANITKGKDSGKLRLRQLQMKSAEAGNVTMQIWLGKQMLKQSDRAEYLGVDGGNLVLELKSDIMADKGYKE